MCATGRLLADIGSDVDLAPLDMIAIVLVSEAGAAVWTDAAADTIKLTFIMFSTKAVAKDSVSSSVPRWHRPESLVDIRKIRLWCGDVTLKTILLYTPIWSSHSFHNMIIWENPTASLFLGAIACCYLVIAEARFSEAEQARILQLHNEARAFVQPSASNMLKLYWSNELANEAWDYVSTCPESSSHPVDDGENLSFGWPNLGLEKAITNWEKQSKLYSLRHNKCREKDGCGGFTQMAWATTKFVGCAKKVCDGTLGHDNVHTYICRYWPQGNWQGEKPWLPGKACSLCPRGTTCIDGLCADKSIENGRISPSLAMRILKKQEKILTDHDKKEIIRLHNHARSHVVPRATNMLRISWSDELAKHAQLYANECPEGHSHYPKEGENLSWGWPRLSTVRAVELWNEEAKWYDFDTNSCDTKDPKAQCGHYTQVRIRRHVIVILSAVCRQKLTEFHNR